MRFFLSSVGLAVSILLLGCAQRSFQGQVLAPAALAAHRTVAILPFAVELERLRDGVTYSGEWPNRAYNPLASAPGSQLQAERRQMGYQLQAALQAGLMQRQVAQPTAITFQNPADTNQRLARAGISYESLATCPMAELRVALGVDAIIRGETDMRQLLPGGVSIAVYLLSNNAVNPMADNTVRTYLDIYDTQTSQLAWHFRHELRGKPSTSAAALANDLLRHVQGSFPYFRP